MLYNVHNDKMQANRANRQMTQVIQDSGYNALAPDVSPLPTDPAPIPAPAPDSLYAPALTKALTPQLRILGGRILADYRASNPGQRASGRTATGANFFRVRYNTDYGQRSMTVTLRPGAHAVAAGAVSSVVLTATEAVGGKTHDVFAFQATAEQFMELGQASAGPTDEWTIGADMGDATASSAAIGTTAFKRASQVLAILEASQPVGYQANPVA